MPVDADHGPVVKGGELTTWSVSPGGTHVCLGFATTIGSDHRIVLPFDAVSALLMTLPRMLQSALDKKFGDGTLRVVQPLETWRLEQAEASAGLILNLGAPGGFEVAFALNNQKAASLAQALQTAPDEMVSASERRSN